jgi:flagellar biosynthesis protein FlhF
MHVKRLYRPTVREALMAAKDELGPNALVLSTELVPAHGWRGWIGQRVVRLTAADQLSDGRPGPTVDRTDTDTRIGDTLGLRDTRIIPHDGARAGMAAKLRAAGLDEAFAHAVAGRLTESECRGGSDAVVQRALAAELTELSESTDAFARCEIFVGPPGVGKTTTIAKICAQERARGRSLGLVAADAFRAGAIEQLRAYAAVLGVPFRSARTGEDLESALVHARQPTLVDTAGRSPEDSELGDLFHVLERRRSVRTHLVIAADTSASTTRRIFDRYAPLRPSNVVITKLDECDSLMPVMAVVRERRLPVSYLGIGQRVPEDLARATPAALAAALIGDGVEEIACH